MKQIGGKYHDILHPEENRGRWWWTLILALILMVLVRFIIENTYFKIESSSPHPTMLGQINGVDVQYYVGDITIPNRTTYDPMNPGRAYLDPRIINWDAYVVSSPVPTTKLTEIGFAEVVPWTMLPAGVYTSLSQLDSAFAEEYKAWIEKKNTNLRWDFARVSFLRVSPMSRYGSITGMKGIVSVNLFDFLGDYGNRYRDELRRAISSASREAILQACSEGALSVAFPALAGAHYVQEKELVLPYDESFGAIMEGIARTGDIRPSKVTLVVWSGLRGQREFEIALRGLAMAAHTRIPEKQNNIRIFSALVVAIGILLGVYVRRLSKRRKEDKLLTKPGGLLFLILILVPIVADQFYFKVIFEWFIPMGLSNCLSLIAGLSVLLGVFLHWMRPQWFILDES